MSDVARLLADFQQSSAESREETLLRFLFADSARDIDEASKNTLTVKPEDRDKFIADLQYLTETSVPVTDELFDDLSPELKEALELKTLEAARFRMK